MSLGNDCLLSRIEPRIGLTHCLSAPGLMANESGPISGDGKGVALMQLQIALLDAGLELQLQPASSFRPFPLVRRSGSKRDDRFARFITDLGARQCSTPRLTKGLLHGIELGIFPSYYTSLGLLQTILNARTYQGGKFVNGMQHSSVYGARIQPRHNSPPYRQ